MARTKIGIGDVLTSISAGLDTFTQTLRGVVPPPIKQIRSVPLTANSRQLDYTKAQPRAGTRVR